VGRIASTKQAGLAAQHCGVEHGRERPVRTEPWAVRISATLRIFPYSTSLGA